MRSKDHTRPYKFSHRYCSDREKKSRLAGMSIIRLTSCSAGYSRWRHYI